MIKIGIIIVKYGKLGVIKMGKNALSKLFSNSNDEFMKLKQSLISKHKWTYLDFGELRTSKENFYLILIDNKVFLINKDLEIKTYDLNNVRIDKIAENYFWLEIYNHFVYEYSFGLNNNEKKKITNYKYSLSDFESSFLKQLDYYKDLLINNNETKLLLTNFLDQYFKDFFKRIDYVYYLEDDLLAPIFCRKKVFKYYIVDEVRNNIDKQYQKLLDVFYKRGVLNKEEIQENGFLLLTRCLREIGIEYYSKEFEELYKGYFPFVEEMDIDDCINAYYEIDFLEKNEKTNYGFLTYYLFVKNPVLQSASHHSLLEAFELIKEKVAEYEKNKELNSFERQLMHNKKTIKIRNGYENISIDDIDMMSGSEFEEFICYLFKKMGYSVNLTPSTGDQGIDLIAVKNGLRIGIQTKCYSNSVSNKAIQEVVAGVKHYNLSKAIVITNNYFTKSAIELALSNEVVLWDRSILKEKILELTSEK